MQLDSRSSPLIDRSACMISINSSAIKIEKKSRQFAQKENNAQIQKIPIPPVFFKGLNVFLKTRNDSNNFQLLEKKLTKAGAKIVNCYEISDVCVYSDQNEPVIQYQNNKEIVHISTNQIKWAYEDHSNQPRIIISDINHRLEPRTKNFQSIEAIPKIYLDPVPQYYSLSPFQKVPTKPEIIAKACECDKEAILKKQIAHRNMLFNTGTNFCYICKVSFENAEEHHASIQHITKTSSLWKEFDCLAEYVNKNGF